MSNAPGGDAPAQSGIPPSLRWLKTLVTVLTLTMIAGLITVIALLVTRLQQADLSKTPVLPQLPADLRLPAGAEPRAVTFGEGWIGVLTQENRLMIFNASGQLLDEVSIALTPSQP